MEYKSPGFAAFLGIFGAFGLLYVSVKVAVIAFIGFFIFGFITGGTGGLSSMIICPFIGYHLAKEHNEKYNLKKGDE